LIYLKKYSACKLLQENEICVLEHDFEHHKQLDQNAPNHDLALSLVLQRVYHDLATLSFRFLILAFFKNRDVVRQCK
jgi:hypothetical protein